MPSITSLRLLVAVVQTGSITGGASELGISQQAASRRMAALERELGLTLFERTTRGSQPTAACRVVADQAPEVLAATDRFAAQLDRLTGTTAPPLRIAASLTVAEHLIPQWLTHLRRRNPNTLRGELKLHTGNSLAVAELVRLGEVDIGFVETTDRPIGLAARWITDDELVLVVAPAHAWASATTPISVDLLASTPLVTRERGSGTRRALQDLLSERGAPLPVPPAVEVPTTAAVRAAIADGAGPGVLSLLAVQDDLRLGRLVQVSLTGPPLLRPITALSRHGMRQPAAVTSLLQIASAKPGTTG